VTGGVDVLASGPEVVTPVPVIGSSISGLRVNASLCFWDIPREIPDSRHRVVSAAVDGGEAHSRLASAPMAPAAGFAAGAVSGLI
jgi:hypothetical protein